MTGTEELELTRALGRLEGNVSLLIHNQNNLTTAIADLNKIIRQKIWYDSIKVVTGGFVGGFVAVLIKLGIWG
jgi:cell fate (sporulation/competence/biofilm development) regulator YlbF (YheA/YmcA/DUF963 family)